MGTLNSVPKRLVAVVLSCVVLANCDSCGGDDDPPNTGGGGVAVVTVPSVPLNLSANVGTAALSLGWDVPANNGGSSSLTYDVDVAVTPAAITPPVVTVTGTRALITNVDLVRTYTVAVRARNSAGVSAPTTSLILHPQSVINTSYQPVAVVGDPTPNSGIFDPSVMRDSNGDVWMSYSNVYYHLNGSSQLVQDVGIRLARSTNGGATFNYATTIADSGPATVTDSANGTPLSACGMATCTGRWVYETSWLIDDPTDPNAARRYKLFAHKYFLNPGHTPSATFYHLGSIVMWTASAPGGTWSSETSLLGWNLTPSELTPLRVLNSVNPALADCFVFAEGGASVRGNAIDFVFACPESNNQFFQKIVLLRTTDHANTFQYVSTLLTAADAAPFSATHFSAPALLASPGTAPVLIATPVNNTTGAYAGCAVFPIANDVTGELFRANALAVSILSMPSGGLMGGACTYDRNLGARGILINGVVLPAGSPPVNAQFTIQATQAVLQQP